jgi:hypothetical protein
MRVFLFLALNLGKVAADFAVCHRGLLRVMASKVKRRVEADATDLVSRTATSVDRPMLGHLMIVLRD